LKNQETAKAPGTPSQKNSQPLTTPNWLPKPATKWIPQIVLFAGANCGHEHFKKGFSRVLRFSRLKISAPLRLCG
jgi:hypothetical protein